MSEVRIPALAKGNVRLEVSESVPMRLHELRTHLQSIRARRVGCIHAKIRPLSSACAATPRFNQRACREKPCLSRMTMTSKEFPPTATGIAWSCQSIKAAAGLAAAERCCIRRRLASPPWKKATSSRTIVEIAAASAPTSPFYSEGGVRSDIGKGDENYPLRTWQSSTCSSFAERDSRPDSECLPLD